MCSGRVDLEFVLRAFSNGMDGVFLGGCRLNECNYITHGNYDALNMVLLCKKIMSYLGMNPERLRIEFMSSGEGNIFTEVVDDFSKKIKERGPLGKSEGINTAELKTKLDEIRQLVALDIDITSIERYKGRMDAVVMSAQQKYLEEQGIILKRVISNVSSFAQRLRDENYFEHFHSNEGFCA